MKIEAKTIDPNWMKQIRDGSDLREQAMQAVLGELDYWRAQASGDAKTPALLRGEGLGETSSQSVWLLHSPYPDGTWRGLEKCTTASEHYGARRRAYPEDLSRGPLVFLSADDAEKFCQDTGLVDMRPVRGLITTPFVRQPLGVVPDDDWSGPPPVRRVLDISTQHAPSECPDFGPLRHEGHEYGWIVWLCPDQPDRPAFLVDDDEIPEWLLPIVTLARRESCVMIQFDCDASECDGLPSYDW